MAGGDRMLTRAEAAALLRVSERTLDRLARSGKLPRRNVAGNPRLVRFLEADVRALLEDRGDDDQ